MSTILIRYLPFVVAVVYSRAAFILVYLFFGSFVCLLLSIVIVVFYLFHNIFSLGLFLFCFIFIFILYCFVSIWFFSLLFTIRYCSRFFLLFFANTNARSSWARSLFVRCYHFVLFVCFEIVSIFFLFFLFILEIHVQVALQKQYHVSLSPIISAPYTKHISFAAQNDKIKNKWEKRRRKRKQHDIKIKGG